MIPSLIYVERYLNEGTRTYSRYADYTEAREDYRPDSIHPSFACPVFEVPRLEMNVYTAYPPPRLAEAYLGEETVPFCIHPQILAENPDDPYVQQTRSIGLQQQSVIVSPSSSTRTLFVKETDIPHALKLHFPFRISRYNRMMTDEVVAQAISVSREIEEGIRFLDDRFAFLREVIGVSHKDLQAPSFGQKKKLGVFGQGHASFSCDR